MNLLGKVTRDFGPGSLSFGVSSYSAGWNASGQVPLRAVEAGTVDRFGTLDPTEGGSSQRSNAFVHFTLAPDETSSFEASGYVAQYRLQMFSNFTFFARDSEQGDQIAQRDDRSLGGAMLRYRRVSEFAGFRFETSAGGQVRTDAISNEVAETVGRDASAS